MKNAKNAVETLIEKSKSAEDHEEALQFSQSALNVAKSLYYIESLGGLKKS